MAVRCQVPGPSRIHPSPRASISRRPRRDEFVQGGYPRRAVTRRGQIEDGGVPAREIVAERADFGLELRVGRAGVRIVAVRQGSRRRREVETQEGCTVRVRDGGLDIRQLMGHELAGLTDIAEVIHLHRIVVRVPSLRHHQEGRNHDCDPLETDAEELRGSQRGSDTDQDVDEGGRHHPSIEGHHGVHKGSSQDHGRQVAESGHQEHQRVGELVFPGRTSLWRRGPVRAHTSQGEDEGRPSDRQHQQRTHYVGQRIRKEPVGERRSSRVPIPGGR